MLALLMFPAVPQLGAAADIGETIEVTTEEQIRADLIEFVGGSYPEMQITVEPWDQDPARTAIYFIEEKFSVLYPLQRYHYLTHLIPGDYIESKLSNSVWFELAPGEKPQDLYYHDQQVVESITPDVMRVLDAVGFFSGLDAEFAPEESEKPAVCWGDYRHGKKLLQDLGFDEQEQFDIFHVLMAQGGYCDCEILYNAAPNSRLASEYWKARAAGREPRNAHDR